jgi:hypothetical protein
MSTERPAKDVLTFQCDVCFETRDFLKSEGDNVRNYPACWSVMHEEGWRIHDSEHLCPDCAATDRDDRGNPFRRN